MTELIVAAVARFEHSSGMRLAALWALTAILAVAFLALLVGDQVQAAGF